MIGTSLRRLSPWLCAVVLASFVLFVPDMAEACPVCNATKNESSRIAFPVTTAFLSLLPPGVLAGAATGVRGGNRANVSERVMEFMNAEGIWDGE